MVLTIPDRNKKFVFMTTFEVLGINMRIFLTITVFFCLFLSVFANTEELVVAPYLLDVTMDSATVAFETETPVAGKVIVLGKEGESTFAEAAETTMHFIRVTGLEPSQTYRYQVIWGENEVGAAEEEGYQITTAGRAGESFTFVVYGDPRPGDNKTQRFHREVVGQAALVEPVFSLILGDMVDDGEQASLWRQFFQVEAPLLRRTACYTVRGDNDVSLGKGLHARYFPKLEKGYYHFSWSGVHFIALDAWDARGAQSRDTLMAESEQMQWFLSVMSQPEVKKAPFRVVFTHDPIHISRGRASELLRRVWHPLFKQYGVDVVFSSWHLYERLQHEGVTYIVSGGGGAELLWQTPDPAFPSQAEARRHHFCRVDVSAGAMTLRAVASDGTVLDSLTLAPRANDGQAQARMQRAARRLRREIRLGPLSEETPLPVYLFSYDCAFCRRLLEDLFPKWATEAEVPLIVEYYDLALRGGYDLLMAAGADFGRQDADIPTVFVGKDVFGGESEILSSVPEALAEYKQAPDAYRAASITPFQTHHDTVTMREQAFMSLALGMVLGAGLLDGVNPCAFTTVIFLISYLSLTGGGRRRMLVTGGLFTAAVFVTYLAIGLVFYRIAGWLTADRVLAQGVKAVLFVLVVGLALLSARDFWRCLRGRAVDMTLQLPGFLKDRMRARIRRFARNEALIGGAAFGLGVVIAGMELVCTGQVYIPIVTMISEPQYRAEAVFYLLCYNVAFILPLVGVFLAAVYGVTSQKLGAMFARHVVWVKLGLAGLFVVMGVFLGYGLF